MTNFLSICGIVKNEERYLAEWIEFHAIQGVEHFYLYDNMSTDGTREILKKYRKKGLVTYMPFEMHPRYGQLMIYNEALSRYKLATEWMAFLDCDEFLFCPDGTKLKDRIAKEFTALNTCSAIAVHWTMYGTSGLLQYDDRPVIERFTKRANEVNQHCKTIVKMAHGVCVGNNPHTFRVADHYGQRDRVIDERYRRMPLEYAITNEGSVEKLRINHYHLKSKAEATERWTRRKEFQGEENRTEERFLESFAAHDRNELEDPILHKYLPELKERLGK